jgi:isopenicillin-N epimerase
MLASLEVAIGLAVCLAAFLYYCAIPNKGKGRISRSAGLGSRIVRKITTELEIVGDKLEAIAKRQAYARVADAMKLTDIFVDFSQLEKAEFGSDIRTRHFGLDPISENKFLNNGSYGATPLAVTRIRQDWEEEIQRNPVRFRFMDLPIRLGESQSHLASFVGADPNWIVFTSNVNEGVASILRSLEFEQSDAIVYLNIEYLANIALIQHFVKTKGVLAFEVKVEFPCDYVAILRAVKQAFDSLLAQNIKIRLALFDHITSVTAFVNPIEELVALCKSYGVRVLVDGAHAPGQIQLNIAALGADYYAGTLHKWAFAAPGTAFLAVNPSLQHEIVPLMIGHDLTGGYEHTFFYTGHRDYSPFLCVPDVLAFSNFIGGTKKIIKHNRRMVLRMACKLIERWGPPSRLVHKPEHMAAMALIVLPFSFAPSEQALVGPLTGILCAYLLTAHRITVPIFKLRFDGAAFLVVRISCQVFNVESEYDALGDAVASLQTSRLLEMAATTVKGPLHVAMAE